MRVLLTVSRVCKHPVVSGLSSWLLSVPTLLCLSFPSCIRLSLLSTDFSPLFCLSLCTLTPVSIPLCCLWFHLCLPSLDLSFLCVIGISPSPLPVYPSPPSGLFHSRSLTRFLISNFPSSPYFFLPHMSQSHPQSSVLSFPDSGPALLDLSQLPKKELLKLPRFSSLRQRFCGH